MSSELAAINSTVKVFLEGVTAGSCAETTVDVINPSNGRPCVTLPAGNERDIDNAVSSARRAFADGRWGAAPPSHRKRTLHRFADLIEAQSTALDTLDAQEMGKPISVGYCNAAAAASGIRFHAEAVDKLSGDVQVSDRTSLVLQRLVPQGVVGAVVPWNFPTSAAATKVGPALATGNSVVLKPSEMSSRSAIRLAELAVEAGIPPGVFNVVPGLGRTVGRALGLHMDVDMIAFTGSTTVGKQMLQYAGQSNLKKVMVECGGKSPQIVFDDGVDLDVAGAWIAHALLTNQGQICSAGTRLLVQRSLEEALIEKISTHMKGIVIGDALDPKTTFGPLASASQRERVLRYIDTAEGEGARLVRGGKSVLPDSGGYFVEPTIFRNVSPQSRIAQEEIFGPVLSIIAFEDEAEALRIANDTIYGLMAYVWTSNLSTGMRMAKGLRSAVFINAAAPDEGPGDAYSNEPFGQSGLGAEGGLAGMEGYLHRQLVWFNHS